MTTEETGASLAMEGEKDHLAEKENPSVGRGGESLLVGTGEGESLLVGRGGESLEGNPTEVTGGAGPGETPLETGAILLVVEEEGNS